MTTPTNEAAEPRTPNPEAVKTLTAAIWGTRLTTDAGLLAVRVALELERMGYRIEREASKAAPSPDWPRVEPGTPCSECGVVLHGSLCLHHKDDCPILAPSLLQERDRFAEAIPSIFVDLATEKARIALADTILARLAATPTAEEPNAFPDVCQLCGGPHLSAMGHTYDELRRWEAAPRSPWRPTDD